MPAPRDGFEYLGARSKVLFGPILVFDVVVPVGDVVAERVFLPEKQPREGAKLGLYSRRLRREWICPVVALVAIWEMLDPAPTADVVQILVADGARFSLGGEHSAGCLGTVNRGNELSRWAVERGRCVIGIGAGLVDEVWHAKPRRTRDSWDGKGPSGTNRRVAVRVRAGVREPERWRHGQSPRRHVDPDGRRVGSRASDWRGPKLRAIRLCERIARGCGTDRRVREVESSRFFDGECWSGKREDLRREHDGRADPNPARLRHGRSLVGNARQDCSAHPVCHSKRLCERLPVYRAIRKSRSVCGAAYRAIGTERSSVSGAFTW